MAMQTGLEGKPWWQGLAVGVVVGGVVLFATYMFAAKPRYQELTAKDQHLTELQAEIQKGRAAKESLPRFRDEVRRAELELDKLLRILPARRNTPELLRRIRQLTEEGNFELLRFTPGNFIDREFYSEWPITVNLTGAYHNLAMFFDRIGRFSRIINIENLHITALNRNAQGHTLAATFVAKTFIYKEPPPEPPPGKKAPAGRRPPGRR